MIGLLASAGVLLLLVLVAGVVAYKLMIGVAPRVERPVPAPPERAAVAALEERLMEHVRHLALTVGERHLDRPEALEAAAIHIERCLRDAGYQVERESYETRSQGGRLGSSRNLIAELPGASANGEVLVVGAHYDTVLECPGANDNGTGVAALIEIARAMAGGRPARTVRFVAFTNEEPPYFQTGAMGSQLHARRARARGERIVAMLSLETIGYYTDEPGSQRYPAPLDRFYPDTGDFITVVGNLGSRSLVVEVLRYFMRATDFPIEGAATLESIPGVSWSDHGSFWEQGFPGVMLTDTAPFRYPDYHLPSDLPDRIDSHGFARAVHGLVAAVAGLANADTAP